MLNDVHYKSYLKLFKNIYYSYWQYIKQYDIITIVNKINLRSDLKCLF